MWQKVKSVIRRNGSFLLTTHVFPDGDAIGPQLALAQVLRKMGKKVLCVNEHPTPRIYRFLDPAGTVKTYSEELRARIEKCDVAFVLDVGTLERLGKVGDAIQRAGMKAVCIDHHKTNSHFADVNVVDRHVAATGELVHGLVKSLGVPVTPKVAAALFVAVATDTGWFRFSNTKARTLRVAADLIDRGANPDRLYRAVHETVEWPRMELMRLVLKTLRSEANGRIAHLCITKEMLNETGATHEDAEDFVDIPRVLGSVQLIILFRGIEGGVKVSLRSKDGPAVDELARKHGGGGHAKAAGIVIKDSLKNVMNLVLTDARNLLRSERN